MYLGEVEVELAVVFLEWEVWMDRVLVYGLETVVLIDREVYVHGFDCVSLGLAGVEEVLVNLKT